MDNIRLTQFSPGSGCGCKISPRDLEEILKNNIEAFEDVRLLVGHQSKDDAAVYDIGNNQAVISTTDFFTPIVDDAFLFGRISAINAMSDVYAMGGKPLMAISILGWPLDKLSKEHASKVIEGAISACKEAKIPLAGGHSIDIPVPIFGLAVTGLIETSNIKRNDRAIEGHQIFLSKPLGIGILSTAAKKGIISKDDLDISISIMSQLNSAGTELGKLHGVSAMTDVTGFGLLGHLLEMCEGSGLSAMIDFDKIPIIKEIDTYIKENAIPGGTFRNLKSYESKAGSMSEYQKMILADPQTSGGLLIAISEEEINSLEKVSRVSGAKFTRIGKFVKYKAGEPFVKLAEE